MKSKPFKHQLEDYHKYRDEAIAHRFWDQGTGKSKTTIDEIFYNYEKGTIDATLIVAPNGVQFAWALDQFVDHGWNDSYKIVVYRSAHAGRKSQDRALEELLRYKQLAVLCISYDAFRTKAGKLFVWRFLKNRKCFYVLDESQFIKTPSAKRTRSIVASGHYARMRRILTGTPVAESPFDAYSQMRFLDEKVWTELGIQTYAGFKSFFGQWTEHYAASTGRSYQKLISYRNLEKLTAILSRYGSRYMKVDVLDLPPRVFQQVYVELTPKQRKYYNELRDTFRLELSDRIPCDVCDRAGSIDPECLYCNGTGAVPRTVTTALAMVRLLRLQQLVCGYVPTDEGGEPFELFTPGMNPRIKTLLQVLEEPTPGYDIVFARFRKDIDQIMDAVGEKAVRYDGTVDEADRVKAIEKFRTGNARVFVANAAVAGTGLNLTVASRVVYYSNAFSLTQRLQSLDRLYRIGQEHPVTCVDLIGLNTVDTLIVKALRNKEEISAKVLGDDFRKWL